MKRFFERLAEAFFAWCDHVLAEPEERLDPPHSYARAGTLASYRLGNRCVYCGARDDQRRAHTDVPCERPYRPELA